MWSDSRGASCPPSLPFPARPRHSAILVFPQTCLLWGLHASFSSSWKFCKIRIFDSFFSLALSFNVTFSEKASFYTLSMSLHWLLVIALYYLYIHLPIISLLLTIWWSISIFVWHYIGLMRFSNYYFVYLYKFISSKQAQNPMVSNENFPLHSSVPSTLPPPPPTLREALWLCE